MLLKILIRLPFTLFAIAAWLMYAALKDPAVRDGPPWKVPVFMGVSVVLFLLAMFGLHMRHGGKVD